MIRHVDQQTLAEDKSETVAADLFVLSGSSQTPSTGSSESSSSSSNANVSSASSTVEKEEEIMLLGNAAPVNSDSVQKRGTSAESSDESAPKRMKVG